MTKILRKYWITFKNPPTYSPLQIGCGVTAFSSNDAEGILSKHLSNYQLQVEEIVEDVDVRDLDQDHVIPNMSDCTVRGIWFPAGYPV